LFGCAIEVSISVPDGWNVVGLGCCGIAASDSTNLARGIVALNHLHQGFNIDAANKRLML